MRNLRPAKVGKSIGISSANIVELAEVKRNKANKHVSASEENALTKAIVFEANGLARSMIRIIDNTADDRLARSMIRIVDKGYFGVVKI